MVAVVVVVVVGVVGIGLIVVFVVVGVVNVVEVEQDTKSSDITRRKVTDSKVMPLFMCISLNLLFDKTDIE